MTKQKTKIPPALLKNPVHLLSTGFGSGLAPFAPGTMGTLIAIPFYYLVSGWDITLYLGLVVVMSVVGFWLCEQTSKALGVHDHGGIVWDEFVGFFITMIAVPATAMNILVGFILFRIFDIIKPWPINWLDKKVSGGFGIMVDDILAGIYGLIVIQLMLYYQVI